MIQLQSQELVPSAARTSTFTSAPRTNRWGRGLLLILDVTAATATPNLSAIAIQSQGPRPDGAWATLYSFAGLTIATTGVRFFLIYPAAIAAGSFTARLEGPVPQRYRAVVTHDDGDSITYSLTAVEVL